MIQLSEQVQDEILAITKGKMLPYTGVLYIYFTYIMPGLKSTQIKNLMEAAGTPCDKENLRKLLYLFDKDKILLIKSNGISSPLCPIEKAQLKRWLQEPLLQSIFSNAELSAERILQSNNIEATQLIPLRIILRLLMLNGMDNTAWQLLNHAEKIAPEVIESRSDYPYTTDQKICYLENLAGETYTDIRDVNPKLRFNFIPTFYRKCSLWHLPQYLTQEQIKANKPAKHDEKDNISDIALLVAMHTGNWALFEYFADLAGTTYNLKNRSAAFNYCTTFHSCDLSAIVTALKNWRNGKWIALKKLKDIFHYTRKSYSAKGAACDLALRAFLAPLIYVMWFKIANTQVEHVYQAIDALREFYGEKANAFIFNADSAESLKAKDFHLVKWQYTAPIDLLPKALCLARMKSMPEVSAQEIEQMCKACSDLHGSGLTMYSWYMANALLCIPSLSEQQTTELQAIFDSRKDLPLFCDIEKKHGIYDVLLDNMQNLLTSNNTTNSEQNGFIGWRFNYNAKKQIATDVEVYAHKKLKNGSFSAGRRVTISDLCSRDFESYYCASDQEIINHIHKFSRGSMWSLSYELTPALAKLFIGHPHLKLVSKDEILDISLESRPFELEIKKKGNYLFLQFKKTGIRIGVPLHHVDGNVYSVTTLSNKAESLKNFIEQHSVASEGLRIPAQYQDRMLSIISGFTDSVKLKGDIGGKNSKSLKATPKAVALLTPGKGSISGKLLLELYPGVHPVSYFSREKVLYSQIEGKSVCINRNSETEDELRRKIARACPLLHEVLDDSGCWQMELSDNMLQVVEELQHCDPELLESRWQEGQTLRITPIDDFTAFNIKTGETVNDWLRIGGEVQVNEKLVLQLGVLLRNISNTTGRYIELSEGQFLKLSKNIEEQLRALSVMATTLKKGKREDETIEISPALMLMMAQHHGVQALPTALQKHAQLLLQRFNTTFYKPRNINASLRDYQTEGYEWMQRLMNSGLGACLADDMGLGKTLQVLCVLQARAADGPSLVIAPASVCNNWCSEAAKFTPALNVYQLENDDREQLVKKLGKRDVLICSYHLLVTEAELLTSVKWNAVVLDEAQYIKNSQTQRTRAACALHAKCRIAATGTPIENSLDELWSIFEFINPGYLGTQERFRERFANNPAGRKLLRRIVAPFVLRRLKADVLDELPEKTEITRSITLNEAERALYEACRRDALLKAQASEDRFTILAQLMRMRRMCCHPQLVDATWAADGGKLSALVEMVEELRNAGHKALIFSQFTDMLALVRARFEQEGVSYLYLDGSTPKAKRGKLVEDFQNGEADCFLISLKAGGTGLNLTAADYVILLDPWWNPAVETQAADRTHRIGQKRPVTVCRFVCKDTIEERVMELHARKRELFDQVFNDTGKAAPLSITELRELM